MTTEARPAGRLQAAARFLTAGYVTLLASLVIRHPVALTVMIPLGSLLIVLAIFLWLRAVVAEARAKGMV